MITQASILLLKDRDINSVGSKLKDLITNLEDFGISNADKGVKEAYVRAN